MYTTLIPMKCKNSRAIFRAHHLAALLLLKKQHTRSGHESSSLCVPEDVGHRLSQKQWNGIYSVANEIQGGIAAREITHMREDVNSNDSWASVSPVLNQNQLPSKKCFVSCLGRRQRLHKKVTSPLRKGLVRSPTMVWNSTHCPYSSPFVSLKEFSWDVLRVNAKFKNKYIDQIKNLGK